MIGSLDPLDLRVWSRPWLVEGVPTNMEQVCMMQEVDHATPPDITIFTDASGSWGCGALWDKYWLQLEQEGTWADQQIAIEELVPIVAACAV